MNVINAVNLGRLRNAEHAYLNENLDLIIIEVGLDFLPFEEMYPHFKMALNNELEAFAIITRSDRTEEIFDEDRRRDRTFIGFKDSVKGFRNHYAPEFQKAAKPLWNLIKHYGNVPHKAYGAEYMYIKDLIVELQRPEMEAALETLSLTGWVAELNQADVRFQQLMLARHCETTEKTTHRMKTARKETDKYYRAIVEIANHKALIGDVSPKLQHFITELNSVILRTKRFDGTKSGKKKEEDSV